MADEPDSIRKYRQAFQMLDPDENGKVHRDTLKAFLEKTLGTLFDEQMAQNVIDYMKPDKNGMITIEGFMDAFSLNHWSPETLAALYELLESSPDLVKGLADWKGILTNLGLNMNEEEVGQLISQARKCAADLLSLQLRKEPPLNKEEVGEKSSQILHALQEKLHLLDIGGAVLNKDSEDPASQAQ